MSNTTNDALIEQVQELISYWEGTMHARVLQRDLDTDDWEALKYHADLAWREMRLQEDEQGIFDEVQ
jgi:hypothetical protein